MVTVTSTNLLEQYDEQLVAEHLEALTAERDRLPRWRRALLRVSDRLALAREAAASREVRRGALRAGVGAAASLGAAGCAIAGVHELAGAGWALLSAVPWLLLLERRLT